MSLSRSTTRNRISLDSGAGSRGSLTGLIGAIVFHAVIVIAMLFTWEHRLDIAEESPPVVPVDLVTIAQKTNIARAAPKVTPHVAQPQFKPEEIQTPTPPVPEQKVEPLPQPPAPQPRAEPAPVEAPPPPVMPKTKPQPQPVQKKEDFSLNNIESVLNDIAPQKQASTRGASRGAGAQTAMTMDLQNAIRNQIIEHHCWSEDSFMGAPHPDLLIVKLEIWLAPDGSVARAPQLIAQSGGSAGNPFMVAARDAAIRAVQVCAPFKLPSDRYAEWRYFTMTFDPRDLADQ